MGTADRSNKHAVLGVVAPPPRPTVPGAALLAALVTCPVAVLFVIVDLLWL